MNFENSKSNINRSNILWTIDIIENKALLAVALKLNFKEIVLHKLANGVSVRKSMIVNNIKYNKTLVIDKISICSNEKETSPIKIFVIKNRVVSPKKTDIILINLFKL